MKIEFILPDIKISIKDYIKVAKENKENYSFQKDEEICYMQFAGALEMNNGMIILNPLHYLVLNRIKTPNEILAEELNKKNLTSQEILTKLINYYSSIYNDKLNENCLLTIEDIITVILKHEV
jgi:hypothetical protein